MRPARALAAGLIGITAALALSAAVLAAGNRHRTAETADRALYLRSGATARRLWLSWDSLGADVYWIRAIQHYGRDRKSARTADRFELLAPLLDLTTTLDPQFNIPYRFGAVFLAEPPPSGPGRPDQAVALLERGLRANPVRWQYAMDVGFTYYWYTSDFTRAADWFDRAAAMPNAPIWLRQLAANARVQGGDRAGARRVLSELAGSEEAWVRRAASRGLDQLAALDTIDALQRRLDAYVAEHHGLPPNWAALDPSAPAGAVPVDPTGVPYTFDAVTRRIALSPKSTLSPLPKSMSPAR